MEATVRMAVDVKSLLTFTILIASMLVWTVPGGGLKFTDQAGYNLDVAKWRRKEARLVQNAAFWAFDL